MFAKKFIRISEYIFKIHKQSMQNYRYYFAMNENKSIFDEE